MKFQAKHISVNRTSLAYIEAGSGEDVVFVHGSLGDYRNWDHQVRAIGQSYHAVAYSRRGHYPNIWDPGNKDYSAEYHAEDLREFIVKMGLQGCHLVGASYGALSCLVMAIKYPGLIASLTLGEPPILPWLKKLDGGYYHYASFIQEAWEPAQRAFRANKLEEGVRNFLRGVTGRDAYPSLSEDMKQRLMDNAKEMQAEALSRDIFPELTCEQVASVNIPVLLLSGEHSPPMFSLIEDELARCLPDTMRFKIPKASHSLQTGNPTYYNKVLLDFLDQLG